MKKPLATLVIALAISSSPLAWAHSAHEGEKAYHGGILAEDKGLQYELVAKPDVVTVFVHDHGKPISTKGATGKIMLLNGGEKSEATLIPTGESALEARGNFKVEKGTKAVAVVALAGKPARSVRFPAK